MRLKTLGLFFLSLLCYTCLNEDYVTVSLPITNVDIQVNITSVNGADIEAKITNLKGFKITDRGFIRGETDFSCPDKLEDVDPDLIISNNSTDPDLIIGKKSDLPLNQMFTIKAFLEIEDTTTNARRIICSDPVDSAITGNLDLNGSSEIINRDGKKIVRLNSTVNGIKVNDKASNHGFVWYDSKDPVKDNHPDPRTLIAANNPETQRNLGEKTDNTDFEEELEDVFDLGVFYYVMPFIELDGQFVFDVNVDGSWKYEEVFIGDFWVELQNNTRSTPFPGALAEAVSFEIDGIGYIGTGLKVNNRGQFATSTFWAYDPEMNDYERLANFPGIEDGRRRHAVGFAINGKGYVGLGYIGQGNLGSGEDIANIYKDFYEFTPNAGERTWRKLADAPFPIWGAGSFVLDNKGYVVAGWITLEEDVNGDGNIDQGPTNRVFRFNPEGGAMDSLGLPLGEWVQLGRVPNSKGLVHPVCFAVNDKGYIATGVASNGHTDEIYEFTPTTDGGTWERKQNFPGASRQKTVSFVIADKAYLTTGSNAGFQGVLSTFNDLWEYNNTENIDSWTQKADIDEFNMDSGTAFTIRGKGYVYGGYRAREFSSISFNLRIYTPTNDTFKKAIKN